VPASRATRDEAVRVREFCEPTMNTRWAAATRGAGGGGLSFPGGFSFGCQRLDRPPGGSGWRKQNVGVFGPDMAGESHPKCLDHLDGVVDGKGVWVRLSGTVRVGGADPLEVLRRPRRTDRYGRGTPPRGPRSLVDGGDEADSCGLPWQKARRIDMHFVKRLAGGVDA